MTNSDFTKECRELRKKGATAEQLKYATKLDEACDRLDQLTKAPEQPPAGDFTKMVRLNIQSWKSVIVKITDCRILSIIDWIPQLCDRLDRSEASRNELLTALECFPKKLDFRTYEQFYNRCMSWIRTHQDVAIKSSKELAERK